LSDQFFSKSDKVSPVPCVHAISLFGVQVVSWVSFFGLDIYYKVVQIGHPFFFLMFVFAFLSDKGFHVPCVFAISLCIGQFFFEVLFEIGHFPFFLRSDTPNFFFLFVLRSDKVLCVFRVLRSRISLSHVQILPCSEIGHAHFF